MFQGLGWLEILIVLVMGLIYIGIPVVIIFFAVRAYRRIFRKLDQIQEELQSIRDQLRQADQ